MSCRSAFPSRRPSFVVSVLAWAVPASVAPSAFWRLAALAGVYGQAHPVTRAIRPDGAYVICLSLGTLLASCLTIGLVRGWGVVWPSWVPLVGRRPVPVWVAVGPAALGAIFATLVALYALINSAFHIVPPLNPDRAGMPLEGADLALVDLLYRPLLLTGPMMAVVTVDYYRRRTR